MLPHSTIEILESRRLMHATPAISISDVTFAEGQDGTTAYVFTVSLSKPSSKRVGVNFATENGSALEGQDYAGTFGTLSFARGETSKTISVMVNGDATVEQDESFSVKLSRASNAFIADSRGVGTIFNDDVIAPPPPLPPPPYEPPPDTGYDPGWFNPPLEGGAYW